MLNFGSAVALESHKQQITTQNSGQANNGEGFDATKTSISIFGFETRQNIQKTAEKCNLKSNELSFLDLKTNSSYASMLCNNVNGNVQELQSLISWSQTSGQELLALPGLSDAAKSEAISTIQATLAYGQQVITNAIKNVDQAVTNLKTNNKNTPEVSANISNSIQNTEKTFADSSAELVETTNPTTDKPLEEVNKTTATDTTTTNEILPDENITKEIPKELATETSEIPEIKNSEINVASLENNIYSTDINNNTNLNIT
ncbi:MAG TPA: hypothetical protein P5556_01330 [Candidatus Gastranaerophilales bacterium]|nr:hypothetical protein [Candidatus Gastranaerophilales bacterium]